MNIGIYKPGKKIYFFENTEDHASWSNEIINVAKIFAKNENEVYFLSPTDYDNSIEGFHTWGTSEDAKIDKIFVFNGVWTENEKAVIKRMKELTEDINFICTDLRLMTNHDKLYRKVFAESVQYYSPGFVFEHNCFDREPQTFEKTIRYYFAGTERGRKKDFFEYIYRPDTEWYGKSESLGVIDYIPFNEHIEKLKKAKSTIIIADEECNAIGFVTHRYYESAMLGVVCFADSKFDPDELIMKKDDWRRVSNFAELLWKQKRLDDDPDLYQILVENQFVECRARSSGKTIYNFLMK